VGNKIGWIVAAAMVAFIALLAVNFIVYPDPTDPTSQTLREGVLEKVVIEQPIADITGVEPSGPGNAAEHYHAAIEHIRQNPNLWPAILANYRNPDAHLDWEQSGYLTQVMELMQPAASIKEMEYFFVYTPKEFIVSSRSRATPELEMLAQHLKALWQHYTETEQHERAVEAAKTLAIFGWHVANERVRTELTLFGFQWQQLAAELLARSRHEQNNDHALKAAQAYANAASTAKLATRRKREDLLMLIEPPAGDIFNVIENDEDRAWRVDAILQLGTLRFTRKGHRGDQRQIKIYLEKYLNSDDPYLKAAAQVAQSCTMQQLNEWAREK
jgi:hypothetical protein